ncbi:MAG TPA: septal ring lytic transglycosylase RlpA family protein [Baekduia sp.]|nr:septal ring lytic transglycosylase RlpA family protein [Baekduia sp.]
MSKTNLLKLGAALCGLTFAAPAMAVAADAPTADPSAPVAASPGGMTYNDPSAPTVFADGSTLTAPLGQLVGATVTLHGVVAGSHPGDAVAVQRLDPLAGWMTATTATVAADGSYDAVWQVDKAGKTTVRAILATQAMTATRTASAIAPVQSQGQGRAITLYRRAKVTWYGPGFYGRRTACGKRMSRALLGVAHKTLPCGTLVDLYNNGRTVTVPVIDRGPFRPGTSYDLTAATARAIGVRTTTTIGAVRSVPAPVVVAGAAGR